MANILHIDDQELWLEDVNNILTGEGHNVTSVLKRWDFLDIIEKGQQNLLIIDNRMPSIDDGYRLVGNLDSMGVEIPVIMCTSDEFREVEYNGPLGYVDKNLLWKDNEDAFKEKLISEVNSLLEKVV